MGVHVLIKLLEAQIKNTELADRLIQNMLALDVRAIFYGRSAVLPLGHTVIVTLE